MDKDNEPNTWLSALKIVLAVAVIIGTIGFGLWYANQRPVSSPALEQAKEEVQRKSPGKRSSSDDSWGIVHDSPIRPRK